MVGCYHYENDESDCCDCVGSPFTVWLLHNYENNALVTVLLVLEAGQHVRAHAACIDRGTYMHCQLRPGPWVPRGNKSSGSKISHPRSCNDTTEPVFVC